MILIVKLIVCRLVKTQIYNLTVLVMFYFKKNKQAFLLHFSIFFWIDLADANVGFIATSVIMGIVMIVMIVGIVSYVVKQKRYSLSTNRVGQNYELPTVPKPTNEYEEIRNKIDNNVSEYNEIVIFDANTSRSEYSNIA